MQEVLTASLSNMDLEAVRSMLDTYTEARRMFDDGEMMAGLRAYADDGKLDEDVADRMLRSYAEERRLLDEAAADDAVEVEPDLVVHADDAKSEEELVDRILRNMANYADDGNSEEPGRMLRNLASDMEQNRGVDDVPGDNDQEMVFDPYAEEREMVDDQDLAAEDGKSDEEVADRNMDGYAANRRYVDDEAVNDMSLRSMLVNFAGSRRAADSDLLASDTKQRSKEESGNSSEDLAIAKEYLKTLRNKLLNYAGQRRSVANVGAEEPPNGELI